MMLDDLGSRLKAALRGKPQPRDVVTTDFAVVGLVERVRDEWHRHNRKSPLPTRFGLRDLLSGRASLTSDAVEASALRETISPDPLDTLHWTDASGHGGPVDAAFLARQRYPISALTSFEDATFVDVAFRCLLKRPADEQGLTNFVHRLRNAELDRIDVLRGLSGSPEGRLKGVAVEGLPWLAFWRRARRAPVIGTAIVWTHAFFRLPRLFHEQRLLVPQTRALLRRQREDIALSIDRRIAALTAPLEALGDRIATTDRLVGELTDAWYRLDAETVARGEAAAALQAQQSWLLGQIHRLTADVNDRAPTTAVDLIKVQQQSSGAAIAQLWIDLESRAASSAVDELRRHAELLGADLRHVADDLATRATVESIDALRVAHETAIQAFAMRQTAVDDAMGQVRADLATRATTLQVDALADTNAALLREASRSLAADAARASERLNAIETFDADAARTLSQIATTVAPIAAFHEREQLSDDEARGLEHFYEGLEARFRGARDDIIMRFAPYLPLIREAGAGTVESPIIDLGCGRGEWLELLKLNLLHAYGIDSSAVMVEHCRAHDLAAEQGDVLTYLRATRAESFGAVSAIHIVEHLSFKTLVLLIREIHRVLKPGGILLFETPNPENLFVAAYAFRMDPTHRVPLPPPMLEYLVESQGFDRPTVLRMNQGAYGDPFGGRTSTEPEEQDITTILTSVVQRHLYCAPDYAVVARKATASSERCAEAVAA